MPGRCGTLALRLCFTVSHLSCCVFTTRTAEGRRRRKPVLGCQRAPGTSSGRFVFEQEASLLQPGQAPPYGPLGAPLGEEGPCEASHPMAGGRGREGLSAEHSRTTPTGPSGQGSLVHGGHCFPPSSLQPEKQPELEGLQGP